MHVQVTVVKPSVNISISTNLCSKFRDEINKNMAKIKSGAEHAMAELGPKITHTVMELISKLLKKTSLTIHCVPDCRRFVGTVLTYTSKWLGVSSDGIASEKVMFSNTIDSTYNKLAYYLRQAKLGAFFC